MSTALVFLLSACIPFGLLAYCQAVPDVQKEESNELPKNESDRAAAFAQAIAIGGTYQQRPQARPSPNAFFVECFVCTDCPKVNDSTPSKLCPENLYSSNNGKCVVYAEKYRHMNRPWYIRGCATERGSCADIRKAHEAHPNIVKLLFCEECEGSWCNRNSATSLAECTIAFIMLIVTPVVSKFTLS